MSGLVACDTSRLPTFPSETTVAFAAPPHYRLWWSLVESCMGIRGSLESVRWFRTERGLLRIDGEVYSGYWWSRGNRVVVSDPDDGRVVRHEMLHAVLRVGDHPAPIFVDRCGGLVDHDAPEGYGIPPANQSLPGTPASAALEVSVRTVPARPRVSENGGRYVVVVTATSRVANAVRLPDRLVQVAFDREPVDLVDLIVLTSPWSYFDAGAKREVFLDAAAAGSGTVRLRGRYGDALSPWTTVRIDP